MARRIGRTKALLAPAPRLRAPPALLVGGRLLRTPRHAPPALAAPPARCGSPAGAARSKAQRGASPDITKPDAVEVLTKAVKDGAQGFGELKFHVEAPLAGLQVAPAGGAGGAYPRGLV
jgi:hypothetical protein